MPNTGTVREAQKMRVQQCNELKREKQALGQVVEQLKERLTKAASPVRREIVDASSPGDQTVGTGSIKELKF